MDKPERVAHDENEINLRIGKPGSGDWRYLPKIECQTVHRSTSKEENERKYDVSDNLK